MKKMCGPKGISNSSTKIEHKNKTTNLKPKKINYNIFNFSTFTTNNQKIQINNSIPMYNINKKSQARNLYMTRRKIW
jgi:hypothetical protein